MGDGATTRKMPPFNILAATNRAAPAVMAVHGCSKHLVQGGKKYAKCFAIIFIPQILTLDPRKEHFDLYIVDGVSNVQSAGHVVEAYFPCITTIHGSEHGISLAFADIIILPEIKVSSPCSWFPGISLHRELTMLVVPFQKESYFSC